MSKLTVIRADPDAGFLKVANATVRPDGQMSMQALGLLVHLLSHESGRWDVTAEGLADVFSNGVQAVKSAVRELEDLGHLVRTRRNTAEGFVHTWTVYEDPAGRHAPTGPEPIGRDPIGRKPTDGIPPDIKKTTSTEDQLAKDHLMMGSSATRPTTRDLDELALVLGETDPLRVLATWLAMKADRKRNPSRFAKWLDEGGQLDGYLAAKVYVDDYTLEASSLIGAREVDPWAVS